MSAVVTAFETGLYTKLNVSAVTNLATGGVWNQLAPQGQSLPYVIFQWQGGGDRNLTPSRERDLVYTVKAVAADKAAAEAIDAQIDTLLHGGILTVSGWTNFLSRREGDVNYSESPAGASVYHVGAMYRFRIN